MPNWCENTITIEGNLNDLKKFYKENGDGEDISQNSESCLDFGKLVPMPEELENTQCPNNSSDEEKKKLIDKYGSDNWYDWKCSNWGTKWNASDVIVDLNDQLTYTFLSAWSPPVNWFVKVGEKYKNLNIKLEFFEFGMDFAGEIEYVEGELVNEKSYSVSEKMWSEIDVNKLKSYITNKLKEDTTGDFDLITQDIIDEYLENGYCDCIYDNIRNLVEDISSSMVCFTKLEIGDKGEKVEKIGI